MHMSFRQDTENRAGRERTENTTFQISPCFHSMRLISSYLEYPIHHKQVKSEGQLSSKGWEKHVLDSLRVLHILHTLNVSSFTL